MKVSDFDYNLPEELIAQTPLTERSSSRLLTLNKETGQRSHEHFFNIIDHLKAGDVLVLNDTKVLPSRIYGEKEDTKAYIEVLLLKETSPNIWKSLVRPARRVHEGTIISFKNGFKTPYVLSVCAQPLTNTFLLLLTSFSNSFMIRNNIC